MIELLINAIAVYVIIASLVMIGLIGYVSAKDGYYHTRDDTTMIITAGFLWPVMFITAYMAWKTKEAVTDLEEVRNG